MLESRALLGYESDDCHEVINPFGVLSITPNEARDGRRLAAAHVDALERAIGGERAKLVDKCYLVLTHEGVLEREAWEWRHVYPQGGHAAHWTEGYRVEAVPPNQAWCGGCAPH